jgi:hypothetical protein
LYGDDDIAHFLPGFNIAMGRSRPFQRIAAIDGGVDDAGFDQFSDEKQILGGLCQCAIFQILLS